MAIQTNDDAARLRTVLKQLRGVALSSEMPRGTLEAMAKVLTADLEVRDLTKEEREKLATLASLPATDATGDNETGLWSGLSMMVRRCVELGVLSPAQALALRNKWMGQFARVLVLPALDFAPQPPVCALQSMASLVLMLTLVVVFQSVS